MSSTRRSAGSAANAQISSLAHGPSLVSSLSCGTGPGWRASISITQRPGRICTRSRPSGSSRAGRSLRTAIGTKLASSALPSSTSRFLPAAWTSTLVVIISGIVSAMRRCTTTSSRFSSAPSSARFCSHSTPALSRCGNTTASPRIFSASSPVSAGTCSFSGRLSHRNAPLTRYVPGLSSRPGRPSLICTTAGSSPTFTSCGQRLSSPGSGTQAASWTSQSCTNSPRVSPSASSRRDGQLQRRSWVLACT